MRAGLCSIKSVVFTRQDYTVYFIKLYKVCNIPSQSFYERVPGRKGVSRQITDSTLRFLNSRKNTKYLGRAIKLLEPGNAVEHRRLRQNLYD